MNTNPKTAVILSALVFIVCLQSCSIRTIPHTYLGAGRSASRPQIIAVFMDGTNNKSNKDPQRNTHVRTTYGLVKKDIRSLYIEGVGSRKKLLGLGLGIGTKARVVRGYRFLSEYYQPGDSIFLFGFSRGANQCRILSNLIYTAGMPDLSRLVDRDKKKLINGMYRQYRVKDSTAAFRKERVEEYLSAWNINHPDRTVAAGEQQTKIELLGLWETVEAFKIDKKEEIVPRRDHLNQVVNVKKALHAVAFDDNRALTYTPILLSAKSVERPAGIPLDDIVEEVWFNGSHRDVGGGAKHDPQLEEISLNWMLAHTKKYNLFNDTLIVEDPFAPAHNMFDSPFMYFLHKVNRNISDYYNAMNPQFSNARIKVHRSVIQRMQCGVIAEFKTDRGRKDWYEQAPFSKCFIKDGTKVILKEDCPCIEVVD